MILPDSAFEKGHSASPRTALDMLARIQRHHARIADRKLEGVTTPNPEQLDLFDTLHAAALANGGTDEGAPGPRPNYGPNWYAAYIRDSSGNKIGVVHNG
jgi:hypothetical protein